MRACCHCLLLVTPLAWIDDAAMRPLAWIDDELEVCEQRLRGGWRAQWAQTARVVLDGKELDQFRVQRLSGAGGG